MVLLISLNCEYGKVRPLKNPVCFADRPEDRSAAGMLRQDGRADGRCQREGVPGALRLRLPAGHGLPGGG